MSESKMRAEKVAALIKAGATVKDACKQLNISTSYYYNLRSKRSTTRRKQKSQITVQDLPEAPTRGGQAFLIYGPAHVLAEFAKAYQ